MKREIRNPKSHRPTEANAVRTLKVLERFRGKNDLLRTWELQPDEIQADHHDEILDLRRRVRVLKNMLLHRAGPDAAV